MIRRLVTRYWLLLPLLILAVVLLDRAEEPNVVQTEETLDMRETRSDYYLSDFRTQRFNADGEIEYIVNGATLAHYPAGHSEIIAPRVELRRDGVSWQVESDKGRLDTEPETFTLQGNVVIKRMLQRSEAESITMNTQILRIANEANLIETDALVEIKAPTWRLQAKGLRTAINSGQLTLLSEVIGRYDMPANKPHPENQ